MGSPSVAWRLCEGAFHGAQKACAVGLHVWGCQWGGAAPSRSLKGKGISWRSFLLNKSLAVGLNAAQGHRWGRGPCGWCWFGLRGAGSGSCLSGRVQSDSHQCTVSTFDHPVTGSHQIPPLLSNSQHLRLTRHLGVVFGDQQPFTDGFSIDGELDPFSCCWRGC